MTFPILVGNCLSPLRLPRSGFFCCSRSDRMPSKMIEAAMVRRTILAVLLAAAAFNVTHSAIWEGRYRAGRGTLILRLAEQPLWSPPPTPTYATFVDTYDHLSAVPSPEGRIYRVLKWDWMLLEWLMYACAILVLTAPFYWFMRRQRPDPVLHIASSIGLGMFASAVLCIGLWLLVGGWGPPAPLFFGLSGLLVGGTVGLATMPKMIR